MPRANTMMLIALAAGATVACRDESPDATGPSPATGIQAATTVSYTTKKLGTRGLQPSPQTNNTVGQTVGTSQNSAGKFRAFIYQAGVMKALGALAGVTSSAYDINDAARRWATAPRSGERSGRSAGRTAPSRTWAP